MIGAPPPLTDGRLRLRLWTPGDEVALSEAWNDPEIRRWTEVPTSTGVRAAELWIDGCERRARAGLAIDLAVVDESEAVIGEVGLHGFDRRRRAAEIGYWVAPRARDAGVATGAVRLLCAWSLAPSRLAAVVARCDPRNEASAAVALSAGLEPVGTHRDMSVYARRHGATTPSEPGHGASAPHTVGRC